MSIDRPFLHLALLSLITVTVALYPSPSSLATTSTQSSTFESLSSTLASATPSEISHGHKRRRSIEHAPNKHRNSKRARAWSFGQEYESVEHSTIRAWQMKVLWFTGSGSIDLMKPLGAVIAIDGLKLYIYSRY